MARHNVIVVCLVIIGICLLLMILLAYAEWVGVGKTYGEMNERQLRAARRRDVAEDRTVPHGTTGGYTNHGCRCSRCRGAWREYKRRYRDENPQRDPTTGRLRG